jgi:hypothetical protein
MVILTGGFDNILSWSVNLNLILEILTMPGEVPVTKHGATYCAPFFCYLIFLQICFYNAFSYLSCLLTNMAVSSLRK